MSISQVSAQPNLQATMAFAALRRNSAAAAATSSPSTTRQADGVNLSETARALSAASRSVSAAGDVREERVAAIKAAIANGTYSVNSKNLARSMVKKSAG